MVGYIVTHNKNFTGESANETYGSLLNPFLVRLQCVIFTLSETLKPGNLGFDAVKMLLLFLDSTILPGRFQVAAQSKRHVLPSHACIPTLAPLPNISHVYSLITLSGYLFLNK